jgi:hypothetical protein
MPESTFDEIKIIMFIGTHPFLVVATGVAIAAALTLALFAMI